MSILMDYLEEESAKKKKSAAVWLEETLKNADKCVWCTHIGKFVHPSVENVAVFVPPGQDMQDGLVHTANVVCEADIAVSANYLATAKLLSLPLEDGRSVLRHFRDDSDQIRRDLSDMVADYEKTRAGVLRAKEAAAPADTDDRIRQVYFPLGDGSYHLLSVLPSSSLLMELRTRVLEMEKEAREARDSKSDIYGQKHKRLPNMTCIGVGGTKPQNISYLNNKHGGKAFLFSSMPPAMEKRDVVRPRKDFFANTLRHGFFRALFRLLHTRYARTQNNLETRQNARAAEEQLIDEVLSFAYRLRELPAGWSDAEGYALPAAQKIWLDAKYEERRNDETEWKQEVATAFARWVFRSYKKIMKDEAVDLSDTEMSFLQQEIMKSL